MEFPRAIPLDRRAVEGGVPSQPCILQGRGSIRVAVRSIFFESRPCDVQYALAWSSPGPYQYATVR